MYADLRPLRLLACALGIAATVALASACGGGHAAHAASTDPPLLSYSGRNVSFDYPASWKTLSFQKPLELHFYPLVYLSTQAIHSPCSTHGNVTSCGWPLKRLQPGGVLAVWQWPYSPPCVGSGCAGPSGASVQVGGRPATQQVTEGGVCQAIGADRTIDVMVKNSVEFTACLRGPNLTQNQRRVDALLESTKFPPAGSGSSN